MTPILGDATVDAFWQVRLEFPREIEYRCQENQTRGRYNDISLMLLYNGVSRAAHLSIGVL